MAMFFIWADLLPAVAVVSQFTPAGCRKQAGQLKLGGVASAKGIGNSEEEYNRRWGFVNCGYSARLHFYELGFSLKVGR